MDAISAFLCKMMTLGVGKHVLLVASGAVDLLTRLA